MPKNVRERATASDGAPGDAAPRWRRVRLTDVAALAGVDASVVSRILNTDPRLLVRPETRRRVHEAVAALGYRPNVLAQNLRQSTTDMYGLAIPDFSNAIYAQIITGAEKQAALIGKHLLTSSLVDFTSESFLEVLGPGRIDGLLIAGTIGAIDTSLDATGVPWLYLNRRSPGRHRHVLLDDQGAGYLATNHLLALGHRHIAHVAGPPSADTALRRHSGYVAALRDAGLSSAAHIVVADYTEAGGARAIGQILQESRQVSAVIVANVASAIGVLSGAHRAGVRVPDQLSVIAIQDLPTAGYLVPPLTTVRMPLEELGRRGVELLARLSAWAIVDETLSAPMEINVRASTAPPPVAAA